MQMLLEVVQNLLGAIDRSGVDLAQGREVAEEALERRDDAGMSMAVFNMALEGIEQCAKFPGCGLWFRAADQFVEFGDEGYSSVVVHGDSFGSAAGEVAATTGGTANYSVKTEGGGVPCR